MNLNSQAQNSLVFNIMPSNGNVKGGEFLHIVGKGFFNNLKCKIGNNFAVTYYSDSENMFCKTPQSENLQEERVSITLWNNNEALKLNEEFYFEYTIPKERKLLLSFKNKLIKLLKLKQVNIVKVQTLIDQCNEILENLDKFMIECTLNEKLNSLSTEFQLLIKLTNEEKI